MFHVQVIIIYKGKNNKKNHRQMQLPTGRNNLYFESFRIRRQIRFHLSLYSDRQRIYIQYTYLEVQRGAGLVIMGLVKWYWNATNKLAKLSWTWPNPKRCFDFLFGGGGGVTSAENFAITSQCVNPWYFMILFFQVSFLGGGTTIIWRTVAKSQWLLFKILI